MPVSSLRFRMTAENNQVLSSLNQVSNAANKLGNDLQRSIGDKLAGVFDVLVIEKMVVKTGEWATELTKASRELGIGTEEMQALEVMSKRAGVNTEKLFSYYNKLESAATKAAGGNTKLISSFKALGIEMKDLRGPDRKGTGELFQMSLQGMGPNGISNEGAAQSIYGAKNYFDVQALARESKGRTIGQYKEAHAGEILPAGEVSTISKAWQSITEDFSAIGTELKPLAGLILTIVDGVVKMIRGIVTAVTDAVTSIPNLVKHPLKTLGRGLENVQAMGGGLIGMVPGATWAINKMMGQTTGGQNYLDAGLEKMTEERRRSYEGAGEGVGTLLTFGTAPILKGAGMGVKGIGATAGFAGADTLAANAGKLGGTLEKLGKEGILTPLANKLGNKIGDFELSRKIMTGIEEDGSLVEMTIPKILGRKSLFRSGLKGVGIAGESFMAGGVGKEDISKNTFGDIGIGDIRPSRTGMLGRIGGFGSGGGSGNLAMGGVFGVDIQGKIISLNSKMVDLLEQIVINTGGDGSEAQGADDESPSGNG